MKVGRRALLNGGLAALAWKAGLMPAWAAPVSAGSRAMQPLSGPDIRLTVGHSMFRAGGRQGHAVTVNGTLPAPLIRLREGERVRLHVENRLGDEDTSIHWHGLLVPHQMDGVPGFSFPGIAPGASFTYDFPLIQNGTYWYHSHSGLQEQQGHYGPLIIDPAGADPVSADREHVIVLSDWTFLHPHTIMQKLKAKGGYFNRRKQTLAGQLANRPGDDMPAADRAMWGRMRMDPTDISDVNGTTYSFLVNGYGPADNWTGLFRPGERVRLRVINASAMTIFHLRIPGLPLTIVQADGQHVRPVETDELQISVAETYDIIVTPPEDRAYTLVAESIDRSGMALATLAPRAGMLAAVPAARTRPVLSMKDMGMGDMGGMSHAAPACPPDDEAMGYCTPASESPASHGGHAGMNHSMRDLSLLPPGVKRSFGIDMVAPMPVDRTGDRPLGLEDAPHRVLTYHDLAPLVPFHDKRAPTRSIDVHLTGNMERFMWSLDGRKMNEGALPIRLERNERVRINLVNNSMMNHPIHLHGHFFEVVTGMPHGNPVKHTVNVMPGGRASFDLTADAPGDWAFHCHLLYHMHAGMMNIVTVRPLVEHPAQPEKGQG